MNSTLGTEWTAVAVARLGPPWVAVRRVASTGSTNADLAAQARAGAPSGTVLVADHQASGRGRLDRSWTAPAGASLAISVLLRPPAHTPPERWLWLPLVAGLAVADALKQAGAAAELKWPNDVLVEGRKICGILAERIAGDDPAVVIGMGINTGLSADQLPVPSATSLRLAGVQIADEDLIGLVLGSLGGWYRRWLAGVDLSDELSDRCGTIGRPVRVELSGTESVLGEAIGIDADGRLLVRTAAGVRRFAAGDVIHLR
ncbi:biotin--[acetyl-CoA-carboxylase] ligase [Propionicimonas sp.]|uniref:biotin--[acetyl-CoA-carboxylase] ligase n=1 Tax=Propionicimonas sp. TaxID=1955623 RepID=UPI00182B6CDF|nr:biotin--[acetyl-CoA-carboxylase] ligase [Propionicimonas sp.]MBU3977095.1 biotin--[acetyl-CoA-carboxylase] ligase [Actinomycetota bacterium]MBA3020664.1 biotin--[acetyl-CoA-carboxylase] ligase [Propionicimonas sp.]MBU3985035.1 biotin--[acetyl-CoA-carboxylase] ligase [Actinomycetota bacterium]MBU4007008.1 biotin--[acetyl-CoA-carboxylase] ligase [Actinomycetota bacterium]MBU4064761.1 biotin--[acetyl-CoA-carboxylase] ligase [Actinomycetota bacterium]